MKAKEQGLLSKANGWIGIVVGGLSLIGIPLYVIGYAYWWGYLNCYNLTPHEFPLMANDYIAMGVAAIIVAYNNIFSNFDWTSFLSIAGLVLLYITLIFCISKIVNKRKESLFENKRLRKIRLIILRSTRMPKAAKEAVASIVVAVAIMAIVFIVPLIISIMPSAFFLMSHNEHKELKKQFSCDSEQSGCTLIKTKNGEWLGWIVASNEDEKVIYTGKTEQTIQRSQIDLEEYYPPVEKDKEKEKQIPNKK